MELVLVVGAFPAGALYDFKQYGSAKPDLGIARIERLPQSRNTGSANGEKPRLSVLADFNQIVGQIKDEAVDVGRRVLAKQQSQ